MEDASLDEFLGSDAEEDAGATAGDEESSMEEEEESEAPESAEDEAKADTESTSPTTGIEPAQPTMVFAPEGEPCETCETVVERRWRAGDGLYCTECLEW